jgi:hypothetical protein
LLKCPPAFLTPTPELFTRSTRSLQYHYYLDVPPSFLPRLPLLLSISLHPYPSPPLPILRPPGPLNPSFNTGPKGRVTRASPSPCDSLSTPASRVTPPSLNRLSDPAQFSHSPTSSSAAFRYHTLGYRVFLYISPYPSPPPRVRSHTFRRELHGTRVGRTCTCTCTSTSTSFSTSSSSRGQRLRGHSFHRHHAERVHRSWGGDLGWSSAPVTVSPEPTADSHQEAVAIPRL